MNELKVGSFGNGWSEWIKGGSWWEVNGYLINGKYLMSMNCTLKNSGDDKFYGMCISLL